jgi:hypothetical protein
MAEPQMAEPQMAPRVTAKHGKAKYRAHQALRQASGSSVPDGWKIRHEFVGENGRSPGGAESRRGIFFPCPGEFVS